MTDRIAFVDLAGLHAPLRADLDAAIAKTIDTSAFAGSSAAREFEDAFAAAHHAPAAAGCGSGTDALTLALVAAGVGLGDEVIVPAMTFVATAEAVLHAGATPVIADVDETTLLLDEAAVEAVRTPRTRAVVPVHLYGHVVPFTALDAWRDDGLVVIEDAAQAHLATWLGAPLGTHSAAACFSFYPSKNLGGLGDGGAVLSHDAALIDEVRRLRDHGRSAHEEHQRPGWCSRLDGLQAAALAVKLEHVEAWNARRCDIAERYRAAIGADLVPWEPGAVHHLLVARAPAARDERRAHLDGVGIDTRVHYARALSQQPSLAPWRSPCPIAERAAGEVVSLPMHPGLTDDDVDRVCAAWAASA